MEKQYICDALIKQNFTSSGEREKGKFQRRTGGVFPKSKSRKAENIFLRCEINAIQRVLPHNHRKQEAARRQL